MVLASQLLSFKIKMWRLKTWWWHHWQLETFKLIECWLTSLLAKFRLKAPMWNFTSINRSHGKYFRIGQYIATEFNSKKYIRPIYRSHIHSLNIHLSQCWHNCCSTAFFSGISMMLLIHFLLFIQLGMPTWKMIL